MKSVILFILALALGYASKSQTVDSVQLMKDVNSLTSGESGVLGNRFAGTRGSWKAQFYITGRFGEMGLEQLYNTYSQPFFFYYKYHKIMGTNLMGYVKGKTNNWIIISAHYDNLKGAPPYAGTDTVSVRHGDNASGIAAMLAMISWFKMHQPQHNLLFIAFDGEQEGLMGSKTFVQGSKALLKETRLNINIDQIGSSVNNTLVVCGTNQHPKLKSLVEATGKDQNISIAFGHDTLGAKDNWINKSDQSSFNDEHIPFIYFGAEENSNPAGSENINPSFFYPAVQAILRATINLDKYIDVNLPSRNKWIMKENGDSLSR